MNDNTNKAENLMLLQEINEQFYNIIKQLKAREFEFCVGITTEAYRQFMLELEIRSQHPDSIKILKKQN